MKTFGVKGKRNKNEQREGQSEGCVQEAMTGPALMGTGVTSGCTASPEGLTVRTDPRGAPHPLGGGPGISVPGMNSGCLRCNRGETQTTGPNARAGEQT